MREILFRGKRVDNGEWVVGSLLWLESGRAMVIPSHTNIFGCDIDDIDESIIQTVAHRVIPETVGQYTGLTDKNGMKIFEGDIVRYSDVDTVLYFDEQNCFTGTIKFECGAFGIACNGYIPLHYPDACNNDNFVSLWEINWNEDEIEESLSNINIIGNVHDNPELLDGAGNG